MAVPTIGDRDYARRLCVHSFQPRPGHPIGREMIDNLLENAAGAPAFGLAHRLLANVLDRVITEAERLKMPPHEAVEIFRARLDSGRAEEIGIVDRALVEELGGKPRTSGLRVVKDGATMLALGLVSLFACTFPTEGTGEEKHERIPLPDREPGTSESSSSSGAVDPTVAGHSGDEGSSSGGEIGSEGGSSGESEASDSSSGAEVEPWGTCEQCPGECILLAGANCLEGCELCTHACASDRECGEGFCDSHGLCALACGAGCPAGMACTSSPPDGEVCAWPS